MSKIVKNKDLANQYFDDEEEKNITLNKDKKKMFYDPTYNYHWYYNFLIKEKVLNRARKSE